MQKLLESKTNQVADGLPDTIDAQIILESAPYLSFYQFSLEDTYRTYFEGAMISEHVVRTGIKYSPYQKKLRTCVWITI